MKRAHNLREDSRSFQEKEHDSCVSHAERLDQGLLGSIFSHLSEVFLNIGGWSAYQGMANQSTQLT